MHTIRKNVEALLVPSKEIGLEVSAEKTKYTLMSCEQNAGQYHNIHTGNKPFKSVEHFTYLGKTLTNQYSIYEEIKNRLNSGNAFYYFVQNLLPASLVSKNIKIKIYRTTIFPAILYGCEIWSLTPNKEHRLNIFENRVQRDKVTGEWRRLCNEELNDLYSPPNIIWMIKSRRMRQMGHVACMGEKRRA
jgi:hypothetical protein